VATVPYTAHLPLKLVKLKLPESVKTTGFNRVRVEPLNADGRFSIGHLLVYP
jgi:hypothetical protein